MIGRFMISVRGGLHRQLLNGDAGSARGRADLGQGAHMSGMEAAPINEDGNLDAAFNRGIGDESLIHHIAHETEWFCNWLGVHDVGCELRFLGAQRTGRAYNLTNGQWGAPDERHAEYQLGDDPR